MSWPTLVRAGKGLVRGQVTGQVKVKIKPGSFHRHGCSECGLRYDDACETPGENGRCSECRENWPRARPIWLTSMDPASCCQEPGAARVMDANARQRYDCAGSTDWWQCRTCARTHPYNPAT